MKLFRIIGNKHQPFGIYHNFPIGAIVKPLHSCMRGIATYEIVSPKPTPTTPSRQNIHDSDVEEIIDEDGI